MSQRAIVDLDALPRRYLFVGLGSIGQRHLRNLRALLGEGADIAAFRVRGEPDVLNDALEIVAGQSLVSQYRITEFTDLDAALAWGPEVVFVTNPTSLHVDTALVAARAGCHLFIEKPLGHDLERVPELEAEIQERDLVALVAYQLRHHPAFRRLEQWLTDGMLGQLYSVHVEVGEHLPGFHPYEDYRRSYAARSDLGGGVTLTLIHEIDLIHALFGTPTRVMSVGGRVSTLELDVEDLSNSIFDYAPRPGAPRVVALHQDFLSRPRRRRFRISAEGGQVEWDLIAGTLDYIDASGSAVFHESYGNLPRNALFMSELTHFLGCIQRRTRPLVTVRDGARSLGMALGVLESQRTNLPVAFRGEDDASPRVGSDTSARRLEVRSA